MKKIRANSFNSGWLFVIVLSVVIISVIYFLIILQQPLLSPNERIVGCLDNSENNACGVNSFAMANYKKHSDNIDVDLTGITTSLIGCLQSSGVANPRAGITIEELKNILIPCKK